MNCQLIKFNGGTWLNITYLKDSKFVIGANYYEKVMRNKEQHNHYVPPLPGKMFYLSRRKTALNSYYLGAFLLFLPWAHICNNWVYYRMAHLCSSMHFSARNLTG